MITASSSGSSPAVGDHLVLKSIRTKCGQMIYSENSGNTVFSLEVPKLVREDYDYQQE